MKKFNKFGYASAMLLATAMGFTGCSSDDEMENINPTYDGSSVKTQFSISLTQKANKGGRMGTNKAQEDNAFNGMTSIRLFHFNNEVTTGEEKISEFTDLYAIEADGFNYQNTAKNLNTKVYNNVDIKPGVSHFLFYGETAIADNEGKTTSNYKDAVKNDAVNDITFTPVSIKADKGDVTNAAGQTYTAAQTDLLSRLNGIVELIEAADVPQSIKANTEVIKKMTAGSSEAMRELVKDVYADIKVQYDNMLNADQKTNTYVLMGEILSKAGLTEAFEWVANKNLQFPTAWGLPEGAIALELNGESKLDIKKNSNDGLSTAVDNYVYPASLFYYANTPAGVLNSSYFEVLDDENKDAGDIKWQKGENDPVGTKDVVSNFNKGAVAATTRSVILWNQVQYGVARLETTVKFKSGAGITIKDAADATVSTASGFPVTGVLVGGQKQVDWQFTPTGDTQYVIWDDNVNISATARDGVKNHTLVYETASDAAINIAIELQNNSGADFKGVNGVVPAGAKFYLVAQLDPTDRNTVTQPDGKNFNQVFMQDYVTVANLTIASLAGAYNVVPNLEQPELEFGMSVDLEWQTGLTFDVTIE